MQIKGYPIDSHVHIGDKLEPKSNVCDLCHNPFSKVEPNTMYIKLCLNERSIRIGRTTRWINDGQVFFGLPCCVKCRRKFVWVKVWSIITALVIALAVMAVAGYLTWSHRFWFIVSVVFATVLFLAMKKVFTKVYCRAFGIEHPLKVAQQYQLWQNYYSKGWLPSQNTYLGS